MSTARRLLALVGLVAVVAACSGSSSPTPTPGPTATPGPALTLPELKLALIARFGRLWYCDPDFYPIARQDELLSARERWAEVVADTEAFAAITSLLGLDPGGSFDDAQTLDVYRTWKVLNAIGLDPIGNDTYRFDYLAEPAGGAAQGTRTAGTITAAGEVTIEQQAAAGEPICPICLARGTLIDAPGGPLPVEGLRNGDLVWTLDVHGARVRGTVVGIGSTPAPAGHRVVRLVLADGRTVSASPGHPLPDGRRLGELRAGDAVDGSVVVASKLVAYEAGWTFDLVVSGPTGIYLVDGIPMGTTLRP
ncbi:MAG TPA: Hint domain-containing protein [Candidatus Limnocylindrales bacterium]|nr:Hint domain-containing protein [Candidatus Limnocylindrales bacterium]